MTEKKTRARKQVDWEGVERDYRAGIRTLRDMAGQYGITEGAIRKKAKAEEWERDLTARIEARTEALVRKAEVRKEVRNNPVTEREIVEANAEKRFQIISRQQDRLDRAHEALDATMRQLSAMIGNPELLERIGEICACPDENGFDRIKELYDKARAMPSIMDMMKKCIESSKSQTEQESKVYRIADTGEVDPVEAAARGAAQGAAQGSSEASKSMLSSLLEELKGDGATS